MDESYNYDNKLNYNNELYICGCRMSYNNRLFVPSYNFFSSWSTVSYFIQSYLIL